MNAKIDIGINETDRNNAAQGLAKLLADSYTLYLKTHKYHWNVVGPMFFTLHTMFEQHYMELATAVDLIAERIRALGAMAPGSYAEFSKLSTVQEATGHPNARDMIIDLVSSHETVVKTARGLVEIVEKGADEATLDLITQRIQTHEKTAWMLRSLLEG